MAKSPDPRIKKLERLLGQAMDLLANIRESAPAPVLRRKPRRRYRRAPIIAALQEGARLSARAAERDPRLPSYPTLHALRQRDRAFDTEVRRALQERPKARRAPLSSGPASRHLPGAAHDWEWIAQLIEAGATVGPKTKNRQGLPSHTLIMARRKADPVFAARVNPIIGRRRERSVVLDREAVLSGIRRGAVIKAYPPEAGMARKDLIDRERREDPAFDTAVREAIVEARRHRFQRLRERKPPRPARPREVRKPARPRRLPGAGLDWGDIATAIEGGATVSKQSKNRGLLPSEKVIAHRMRVDPIFAARVAPILARRCGLSSAKWGAEHHENILELVRNGATLWRKAESGMPSPKILRRMRRDSSAFNQAVTVAIAEAKQRRRNRSKLRKMGREAAWEIAQKAVPRSLDPDIRDDVVADMAIMLLTGAVTTMAGDLAEAWKACRRRLTSPRWKEVSLDAPLNGLEGASWVDMLPDDVVRF